MVHDKVTTWSHNKVLPVQARDKSRIRKAATVRDFPPHCGSNVHPPEGEKLKMTARMRVKYVPMILAEKSQENEPKSKDVDEGAVGAHAVDGKRYPTKEMGKAKENLREWFVFSPYESTYFVESDGI